MTTGGQVRTVSATGTITADGPGRFTYTQKSAGPANITGAGTFTVQPDCIVLLEIPQSGTGENTRTMKLRGILVRAGRQILAIQTDPGESVAARFTAP
jgi:hypothetical protein